ncbi:MAG: NAD-dependent epimerase/dehydratase family protein [Candidatus Pacebacteria bacterium]|nr:NAD-dependent epimerase/dehydratase family protein [Candidatus Paceibacterota bacterium]
MAKMIVTGGAGFIGSHLVAALIERGDEVVVLDNYSSGKAPERHHKQAVYHNQDVTDARTVQEIIAGADTVFHLAAIPRVPYSIEFPVESAQANIMGTIAVLTAAARAGVRRVVSSSSGSVYGEQSKLPLTETMPPNPVNPYALQKYAGEQFAQLWAHSFNLETVSLRYFNVYGPGLDPKGPYALAVGAFLLARKEGRPLTIFGDGTITRDYTHVSDVVRANLLAGVSEKVGKGEAINIGTGHNNTIQVLADMIGGDIVYGPARIEAHDSQADNTRAKTLLGWEPTVSLEQGIAALKKEWGL